jgi:hypothetical protein
MQNPTPTLLNYLRRTAASPSARITETSAFAKHSRIRSLSIASCGIAV